MRIRPHSGAIVRQKCTVEYSDDEEYVPRANPFSAILTDDRLSDSRKHKEVTVWKTPHDGSGAEVADDILPAKS